MLGGKGQGLRPPRKTTAIGRRSNQMTSAVVAAKDIWKPAENRANGFIANKMRIYRQ